MLQNSKQGIITRSWGYCPRLPERNGVFTGSYKIVWVCKTKPGKSEMKCKNGQKRNNQQGHKNVMNKVDWKDSKSSGLAQEESLGTVELHYATTLSLSLLSLPLLVPGSWLTPAHLFGFSLDIISARMPSLTLLMNHHCSLYCFCPLRDPSPCNPLLVYLLTRALTDQ